MTINSFYKHPYRVFGWAIAVLLLLLILIAGWRYAVKPDAGRNAKDLSASLHKIAAQFESNQQALLSQTQALANTLKSQLSRRENRSTLFKSMQEYTQFWGAGLYRGEQPLVWTNFSLNTFQNPTLTDSLSTYIEVKQQNNVLLWITHAGFTIKTEDQEVPYHLYTAKRIKQSNALPIGKDREYSMLDAAPVSQLYSIDISIYDPLPSSYIDYRVLQSANGDSLGVVYATANNAEQVQSEWEASNRFWKTVFMLISFILIGLLGYLWLNAVAPAKSLLFQLVIVVIGWIVFNQINIAGNWLPTLLDGLRPNHINSYQALCNFSVDGLFFLATAFTLKKKLPQLQLQVHSTSYFTSIFAALVGAFINAVAIIFTFKACYSLASKTALPLLNLQVFPGIGTILFYFGIGLMLWALTMALFVINQFLLRSCKEQYKLVTVICSATVIAGLFLLLLFITELAAFSWLFIIASFYYAIIFTLSYFFFQQPFTIPHPSPLRTAAVYSILIAIIGTTLTYQAKLQIIDAELAQKIQSYTQQDDPQARALTVEILNTLSQNFQSLTREELQNKQSSIQARFTQKITSIISNETTLFSYDLKLVDAALNVVASYSTDLNSPSWIGRFNLLGLQAGINIEQITKNNIRPVIQQPTLIDAENYQTFYRGWIPVYSPESPTPIAWILCSVYKERPDFNKPIRAVLASENYQDWQNSYVIQEYTNGKLIQTVHFGIDEHYPLYNVLQTGESKALKQDSTIYYTSDENGELYRNLLSRQSDRTILKGTTMLPGYQSILFSFFQLSFSLFISGFIILVIYRAISTQKIAFFGDNERFQYRILDSFLLASILFLILLIVGTHFAIQRQNTDLIQEQLFDKLESITKAVEKKPSLQQPLSKPANITLDSLTASLNVDASFYRNRIVSESTAPQIYQQHLLPYALPYPVYSNLYISQKRNALTEITLGDQPLLIGYRSILSDDEPIGTIAIPTFIKSPKFNKQLLETTSYLIILYLVVFGIFIAGTFFISKQLTRPLVHIQHGLNKISRGNLDTTIPTRRNDEIGKLAAAYNQMVNRLQQLQKELAVAEREAAWKEMAQQVAHEIKNPLTPMKLNIQHLERQLASGDYTVEELREKVETITQNLIVQIQSLNNIASDFSNFSKPIESEFQAVDMNALVQSVSDLYKHDEQIALNVNCEAADATVFGAEDELRRVIINLMKNAHEAMPEGGTIILQTYLRQGYLFIKLEDNGRGISEKDKPKIFVPNFSTKSSGTGLGLAICKKIIEAHDGSISFASIEGKGTTFVIKLPLDSA